MRFLDPLGALLQTSYWESHNRMDYKSYKVLERSTLYFFTTHRGPAVDFGQRETHLYQNWRKETFILV